MANVLTAFNAEKWAMEALIRLEEELGVSALFNRDFDTDMAEKGEVVHTRRLGTFVGKRLQESTAITIQDATATQIDVKLDQHAHVAYEITDRDLRRSFRELTTDFIVPAVRGIAEFIDRVCFGELYNSVVHNAGTLGTAVTYAQMVELNRVMNSNNNPRSFRNLVIPPQQEADIMLIDKFTEQRMTGDGSPLINGFIGRVSGFDLGMSQLNGEIAVGHATRAGTINNASGYIKGTVSLTVADFTGRGLVGEWFVISGHLYQILTESDTTGDTTTITISAPGLDVAVVDNEVVTITNSGLVNLVANYAAGWSDWIVVDGAAFSTKFPQVSQGVSFGAQANSEMYGILEVDSGNNKIMLNRPLDVSIANNDAVNILPSGNYGYALRPGASTLVVKSMPAPQDLGVRAAVAAENGFQLRTMVSYDRNLMKYIYSIDCLIGVKTLDATQAALLLS